MCTFMDMFASFTLNIVFFAVFDFLLGRKIPEQNLLQSTPWVMKVTFLFHFSGIFLTHAESSDVCLGYFFSSLKK